MSRIPAKAGESTDGEQPDAPDNSGADSAAGASATPAAPVVAQYGDGTVPVDSRETVDQLGFQWGGVVPEGKVTKEASPQRDNHSAAELSHATATYNALVKAAGQFPSAASVAGSVVGDHFGSGQVARVGVGGRALATVFDAVSPDGIAAAATPAATAAAVTPTALAAVASPAPAAVTLATPGAVVAAATAASVAAAATTAAPPAGTGVAATFPSKPAPHKVAFLPAGTTPAHKMFPALDGPGQCPAVPFPCLPPMQGAVILLAANSAPDVITEVGWWKCRKPECGHINAPKKRCKYKTWRPGKQDNFQSKRHKFGKKQKLTATYRYRAHRAWR